jgi:cupredoxin-like protein
MNKKRQEETQSLFLGIPKNRLIIYGVVAAILSTFSYLGYQSLIPANGNSPVLGFPINHFIKAKYSPGSGYRWVSGSAGGGNTANPSYSLTSGQLHAIHVLNEDSESLSAHNFNIDEVNVHTRDLSYFESQSITFLADQTGKYHYYCSIHPEMEGDVIVE